MTGIRTWWRTVIGRKRGKVADRGTGKGTRWRTEGQGKGQGVGRTRSR